MNLNTPYKTITREQFLFHEMRTVARLLEKGLSDAEIVQEVKDNNLFQYPTERMITNLANVCLQRFHEADNSFFISIVANSSSEAAKQTCLYLMMNYYKLVWDFMVGVIGEKYKTKDMSFSKKDVNVFFTRLQEQNDTVSSWSEATVKKCKQVLIKLLVENGFLDNNKSTTLNPVLIDFELENAIVESNNKAALIAFNCFD